MEPRAFATRMPLLVMLGLTGCPGDGGAAGIEGSSTGAEGTSGGTAGADGSSESSTMPLGMSEVGIGEVDPCEDPQVIPPPPVDCSGADGVIEGNVILEDGDDPSILEGVVRVEGALRINGTALTDLDFMACVQEVTGDVTIFDNDELVDVDGLWSLSEIGTDFVFSQNDAIEVFDGLPNVSVIPGSVVVRENASLQRLDGFHGLEHLQGLGVDPQSGETFGGNLTVQENPVLESIDGLLGLRTAVRFQVGHNEMLCVSSYQSVSSCAELPEDPLELPCLGCDGSC